MGNTYISPNINKTSERIDTSGNIINPQTKEIIQKIEPEFVSPEQPPIPTETKSSKLDDIISKKIEEIINKKIAEALNNL